MAIKIIDLEESKDDVQTICREITTLVSSSCPQLINYYGSAVFGTKLWIAVSGGLRIDGREQGAMRVHSWCAVLNWLAPLLPCARSPLSVPRWSSWTVVPFWTRSRNKASRCLKIR